MAGMLRELKGAEARMAELSGVVASATAGLVEVIADALVRELWPGYGIHTPEQWVALRCGVSAARARRLVAAARGLADLPAIREAFGAGELTEDHVAVIVRAGVSRFHDDEVVGLARHATVSQLSKGLSFLPRVPPAPAPSDEAAAPVPPTAMVLEGERTRVGFGVGDDGMWWMSARLHPDQGAVVERALQAARDHVFRDRRPEALGLGETANDVSWSDALVRLGEVGLDGLDPATAGGSGGRPGHRYQVIIHWDPTTGATAAAGPEHVDDEVRRQLSCDALIRPWFTTPGRPVALGRRARVVDDRLRTVIEHRDRGCVVPGCGRFRWLVIHHLVHWEHGGATDPANLVALCGEHHRMVHRDELRLAGNPEIEPVAVTDPGGRPVGPSPPIPPGGPPGQAARQLGLPEPGYRTRSGERAQWRYFTWSDPATQSCASPRTTSPSPTSSTSTDVP